MTQNSNYPDNAGQSQQDQFAPHVQQHVPPQWQQHSQYRGQPYYPPPGWQQPQFAPPPRKRRRRIFPWVFLAIQALFLIWIITGVHSVASSPANCQYLTQQECRNATDTGAAIGAGLIIALWAFVDVILGVGYLVMRRR